MGQDYRLIKLYEEVYKKETTPSSSSSKPRTIQQAYKQVNSPQPSFSDEDFATLEKITGLNDKNVLQKLLAVYDKVKDSSIFLNQVELSQGSPISRAYKLQNKPVLSTLLKIVNSETIDNKKCIITYASATRKLRTPKPTGQRIVTWNAITEKHVLSAENEVIKQNKISANTTALKPLVMFALWKRNPQKIEFLTKMPPGIGAEVRQIDSFNETLKGISPQQLILPGDYGEPDSIVPGVFFNSAVKVKGTPKADIALAANGKEVFWISFKESSYVPTEDSTGTPQFQQWGSLKSIYKINQGAKTVIDTFLTKSVQQNSQAFVVFDNPSKQQKALRKELESIGQLKSTVLNDIKSASTVYITKEAKAMYAELDVSQNSKDKDILNVALKAIYGLDFEIGNSVYGPENVNLVLETPDPLNFSFIHDEEDVNGDTVALKLQLKPDSHIIKNPELPDSVHYLPCLYLRRTKEERFLFKNVSTGNTELILAGRTLVYPIGRAKKEKCFSVKL